MTDVRHTASSLALLTVDVLLDDLVGGRKVELDGERSLSLQAGARSVLGWYRDNRDKWSGQMRGDDADSIVDAVGSEPPSLPADLAVVEARPSRILRLVRLRTHRFAGLQAFQGPERDAEPFVFEPRKAVTLLEGVNGSGKTSIANAVMWCLTGHLIRSQREPGPGTAEYLCEVKREGGTTKHLASCVTPMPSSGDNIPADGTAIPADTWVEITFADDLGNTFPPVRRTQSRTARGKLIEEAPDLEALGVDPVAWRIATVMPALIPYLAVGSASELGEAVARLTGLAALVDLSRHAEKASERVGKRMVKELGTEKDAEHERYRVASGDLEAIVERSPAMMRWGGLPRPSDPDAQERLEAAATFFSTMRAEAFADARETLGKGFDPERKADSDSLERDVVPATEQVARFADLPSIRRLSSLTIDDADRIRATSLILELEAQASEIEEAAASPDKARRAQLYARVSAWMREHDHDVDTCPVCTRPLDGVRDPITGTDVAGHLAETERDFLARTVSEWCDHWTGHLSRNLPDVLSAEIRKTLPHSPVDLLRDGFVDELFETPSFKGVLSSLRPATASLVDKKLQDLPAYVEPSRRALPAILGGSTSALQEMLDRLVRALAFADWRSSNANDLRAAFIAIRDGTDEDSDASRAVARRLSTLRRMVQDAAPLGTACDLVARLARIQTVHAERSERIALCGKAVAALGELVPLGALAQSQVDLLRTKLHRRANHWRRAMFADATAHSPSHADTRMDARGVIELQAGRLGVTAPAQHVSNASSLRSAILGFFIAFREHVLTTRGGLTLLCLDDPQELLDNDNRERLARGLTSLAASGAQLLVTSHDRTFASSLVAECRSDDRVEHLSVHPVTSMRHTVALSPSVEEVDRKRRAFEENQDSAAHAREYASYLRVFIEARLGDLFDNAAHPAHASASRVPTLNTLMDRLRRLVASDADEPFTHPIVRRFAHDPALREGAEARRILNQAHHGNRGTITYGEVAAVRDAFVRLRTEVENVHLQFRLHRWREPLSPGESATASVVAFPAMAKPAFSAPICPDLAAFAGSAGLEGSQDVPTETVDGAWFEGKALFYVLGDSFGFAIPSGAVAIVEAEPYPGRDQNLVVAKTKGQLMARRMVRSRVATGVSLSAQMPDPRKSRPTETFDESKVRLHRVVGAVFTDMPPPTGARNEAAQVSEVPELRRVEIAYRVKEDSAVPLVLPGQLVLGGSEMSAADLDHWEGRLVAVTLDDGKSIFKRVGSRLPGPVSHLRQFETIGGLGGSIVVATQYLEATSSLPLMVGARQILGVLYEAS